MSANITTGATNNAGAVGVLVDGSGGAGLATARQILYQYNSGGQGAVSTCAFVRLSQFMNETYTPNTTHTFALQFAAPISTAGGGAEFSDISLQVQPL